MASKLGAESFVSTLRLSGMRQAAKTFRDGWASSISRHREASHCKTGAEIDRESIGV